MSGLAGGLLVLGILAFLACFLSRRRAQQAVERLAQQNIEECRRLLQFDPRNGAAYLRLAEIYENLGQYDQAIEALHTAIQMDLADAGAEFRLNRLLQKKRLEERGLVLCPHCGEEQPRGSRICASCGERFRWLG